MIKLKKKKEKTFLDKIKGDFKKIMLGSIILNILFLIFGIIIYMHPMYTLKLVGIILGIYFIFFGLLNIYKYLTRQYNPIFNYNIFLGILIIILGIFTMTNPFKLFKILTLALGIYLIVVGILKLYETIKLKKYGFDGWLLLLVEAILELLLGIYVAINPTSSMDIVEMTGIFIILGSILELVDTVLCYSKAKDIEKLFKNNGSRISSVN